MSSLSIIAAHWQSAASKQNTKWSKGFKLGVVYGAIFAAYNAEAIDREEQQLLLNIIDRLHEEANK